MKRIMLSCREATLLADKQTEAPLPWQKRLRLKIHTSMCDGCRRYVQQTKLIDEMLKRKAAQWRPSSPSHPMLEAFKKQIIERIGKS